MSVDDKTQCGPVMIGLLHMSRGTLCHRVRLEHPVGVRRASKVVREDTAVGNWKHVLRDALKMGNHGDLVPRGTSFRDCNSVGLQKCQCLP